MGRLKLGLAPISPPDEAISELIFNGPLSNPPPTSSSKQQLPPSNQTATMSSQDPALAAAIKEASKDQLQRILNAIIQIHPDTASTASSLFEAQKPDISEDTRIVSDSGERSPKKRKQVQICAQCKQEYDHAENNARACNWHRGPYSPAHLAVPKLALFLTSYRND